LLMPETFTRWLTRNISHNAARMAMKDAAHQPEALHRIPKIEAAVIKAFKKTAKDYTEMHFDEAGNLFGHPLVNGTLNRDMYNRGCRASSRGGDQKSRPNARENPMSPKTMRAIAFGNNFWDAGVHPAILSTLYAESYLVSAFKEGSEALKILKSEAAELEYEGPVKIEGGNLTPVGFKTLLNISPGFRDIIHFIQIGCSTTSLEHTLRRFEKMEAKTKIPAKRELKKYITEVLPRELAAASKLVLGAKGYALPADLEKSMAEESFNREQCACLSFLPRTISGIAPESTLVSGLAILPQVFRDNTIINAALCQKGEFTDGDLRVLNHAAEATLSGRSTRNIFLDDPHGAAARAKQEKQSLSRPEYFHYLTGAYASAGQAPCAAG
jgi:hypothetical protein